MEKKVLNYKIEKVLNYKIEKVLSYYMIRPLKRKKKKSTQLGRKFAIKKSIRRYGQRMLLALNFFSATSFS